MGCASSTPHINTAGGEMLKAFSNAAADTTKSAESAVQDVTHSLGKTLDTTKENVGTAVTGIAHELGNAFKDKTDEAKNSILEKLHLNGGGAGGGHEHEHSEDTELLNKRNATGQLQKQNRLDDVAVAVGGDDDDDDNGGRDDYRTQRIPTPIPTGALTHLDTDSLKTLTPEPEIEEALANNGIDENPPTPKPHISELERLSVEFLREGKTETDLITDTHGALQSSTIQLVSSTDGHNKTAEKATAESALQRRPRTTEWEKYADVLAKNQKFHPNEIAIRRRLIGVHGIAIGGTIVGGTTPTAAATATTSKATTSLLTTTSTTTAGISGTAGTLGTMVTSTVPPTPTATATAIASSLMTMPTMLTTNNSAQQLKNNSSIPASGTILSSPEHFRDISRTTCDVNRLLQDDESGQSDRNNASSSPIHVTRTRKRIPRASTTSNAKKMHRQLTTLIGYSADRVLTLGGMRAYGGSRSSNMGLGRNFDFNPNRMRVGSPLIRRRTHQPLLPLRFVDFSHTGNRMVNRVASPTRIVGGGVSGTGGVGSVAFRPRNRPPMSTAIQTSRMSSSSSAAANRIGLHTLTRIRSPNPKANSNTATRSLSRSSRSSTNNSMVIRSNCTTPLMRTQSKNSLTNIPLTIPDECLDNQQQQQQQSKHLLNPMTRSISPLPDVLDNLRFSGDNRNTYKSPKTPTSQRNTSSFLSSPRTSPFPVRKSYNDYDDHENKAIFIADLSSVPDNRNLLTPSPYKVRERCAVCYNKYVVK